jgi:hypothetical protein
MSDYPEVYAFAAEQFKPAPDEPIHEWARKNIDFSRALNYDTPSHAPFNPDFAPYMKPVLDWLQDDDTREIWIRKCSRAAATEYVLTWLRWIVAESPRPTYYLTADQLTTERFMESRIKRGFAVCKKAQRYYRRATATQHDIRFEHMDFRVSWPNAKGAFKQDGWAAIVADEFSTWKAFASEMLRKRAGTYPFHKIVGLSSPDPTRTGPDGDPVILEYEKTDQCKWMMPDPETGNPFTWEFGGLKWPEDCKNVETGEWDLARVEEEAYYLTPDGTRIENGEREAVSARGEWAGQSDSGGKGHRGIWITGPMVPFVDGDFGLLAARFLSAKRRGNKALRAYFFENWADIGASAPDSTEAGDNELRRRELDYVRGGNPFEAAEDERPLLEVTEGSLQALFITADVQKYHLWWTARRWVKTGDNVRSALEEWGTAANFDDLLKIIDQVQPHGAGVDIGYAQRYGETADFCADYGCLAMKGEDNMKTDIYLRDNMDAREGKRSRSNDRTARPFSMVTWQTDIFRSKFLAAMRGETPWGWYIPRMAGRQYVRQVCSTHKVNGVWERRKGYPDDHLFDCEVMQLVLARYNGLIQ